MADALVSSPSVSMFKTLNIPRSSKRRTFLAKCRLETQTNPCDTPHTTTMVETNESAGPFLYQTEALRLQA
jgi:hypothetical protein